MKTMPNVQGQGLSLNDLRARKEKNLDAFDKEPAADVGLEPQSPPQDTGPVADAPSAQSASTAAPVNAPLPSNNPVPAPTESKVEVAQAKKADQVVRTAEPARPPARAKRVEFPWDDLNAREVKTNRNQHFAISLATEMKIDWIKERVPQMTRAKFMRQAVEKAAEDMVAHLRRKGIE